MNMKKTVVRYQTAGGAVVTWTSRPTAQSELWGSYDCGGCGVTAAGTAREAAGHATCRALP